MSEESTDFWQDFTYAENHSIITDTYNRLFKKWKDDHHRLTDLVIALYHKQWQHYERGNTYTAQRYNELWKQAHNYALNNLKGTQLRYYLDMID